MGFKVYGLGVLGLRVYGLGVEGLEGKLSVYRYPKCPTHYYRNPETLWISGFTVQGLNA